jgi:RND family efflux transporter MFP subunit
VREREGNDSPAAREAERLAKYARTELAGILLDLGKKEITAPFDGFVADVRAQSGDVVPTSGAICELMDTSVLHASVPFSESDAARIRVGMVARVTTPGGDEVLGTVDAMGSVVRSFGRAKAVSVEVLLPKGTEIRPGSTARAEVLIGEHEGLVLPPTVFVGEGPKRTVFAVGPNGVLQEREVTLGATSEALDEVAGGLDEGTQVVVDPVAVKAANGARVRARPLPSDKAAPDPGSEWSPRASAHK